MPIKKDITVRFWHDKSKSQRHKDGTSPVKITVYSSILKKGKKYGTPYSFTPDDFESVYLSTKPRKNNKDLRDKMEAYRLKVLEIAGSIKPFTFELFEKKIGRASSKLTASGITDYLKSELEKGFKPLEVSKAASSPVVLYYDEYIDSLRVNDQYGTASNYLLSLKSYYRFFIGRHGIGKTFDFDHITATFLKSYKDSMIKAGKSLTTVSMYSRALRTVYRQALKAGIADMASYPFGEGKFVPPDQRRTNIPLSKTEIELLMNTDLESYDQLKARDYFIFAYYGNGANMADILNLKWKDVEGDTITFYRQKTIRTLESKLTPITIYIEDIHRAIIERIGNSKRRAGDYLFPVLNELDDPAMPKNKRGERKWQLIRNHTRYVNQHLKRLSKAIGIELKVTSGKARYSFADHLRNDNVSTEIRMELMGHNNENTHRRYLNTIPAESKREAIRKALQQPLKDNGKAK